MIPDTTGVFAGGVSPNISAGGGGLDSNALFSLMLAGQSLMNFGSDTSKPIDMATPVGSYIGNINKAKMLNKQEKKDDQFMSMVKEALNPDTTSKLTIGPTGATMAYDPKTTPMLKNLLSGEESFEGAIEPGVSPFSQLSTPSVPTPSIGGGPAAPSPFVPTQPISSGLDDITPGDLAGLTTKDITDILGAKHAQEQLKEQSYRDIVDAMYKGAVIKREGTAHITDKAYKEALTAKAQQETEADKPVYEIPGTKIKLNAKDYLAHQKMLKETTPNEVKLYEFALKQGFEGSIVDFKNADWTGHRKDYEKVKSEGYDKDFNTWMLEMAKAGAINLGGKLEERDAIAARKGQEYFSDPKWTEDINKQTALFDKDQAWLIPEKDRPLAKAKVIVKTIEDKIAAGSGAIQSVVMDKDGKTMVWTVKWPSGDVKTVKQAVR